VHFINKGTITKSAGTGILTLESSGGGAGTGNVRLRNDSGTINVAAGQLRVLQMEYTGNQTIDVADGASYLSFQGTGNYAGTWTGTGSGKVVLSAAFAAGTYNSFIVDIDDGTTDKAKGSVQFRDPAYIAAGLLGTDGSEITNKGKFWANIDSWDKVRLYNEGWIVWDYPGGAGFPIQDGTVGARNMNGGVWEIVKDNLNAGASVSGTHNANWVFALENGSKLTKTDGAGASTWWNRYIDIKTGAKIESHSGTLRLQPWGGDGTEKNGILFNGVAIGTSKVLAAGDYLANNSALQLRYNLSTGNAGIDMPLTTIGSNASVTFIGSSASFPSIVDVTTVNGKLSIQDEKIHTAAGSLTIGGTGTLEIVKNVADSTLLVVPGSFNGSAGKLNVVVSGAPGTYTVDLVDYGTLGGAFANANVTVTWADKPDPVCTTAYTLNQEAAGGKIVLELVLNCVTNHDPVANAGLDQMVECNQVTNNGDGDSADVTLDGSGTTDVDAGDVLTYTWKKGTTLIASGVSPTVNLTLGEHTITLIVNDGNGGVSTDTVKIQVDDSFPPALMVGDPINVSADASCQVAKTHPSVTNLLNSAVTSDACDPTVTVVRVDPTFPLGLGVHTVTWTATDDDGQSNQKTSTIRVVDNTDPVISVGSYTLEIDLTDGTCSVSASDASVAAFLDAGNVSASDCGGLASFVHDAPATFGLGTTMVKYTATDVAGNDATVTLQVIVNDKTPPSLTVPGDLTIGCGQIGIAVFDPTDGVSASDTCDADLDASDVDISGDTVDTSVAGTYVINYSVTDASGNQTTATRTITVQGFNYVGFLSPVSSTIVPWTATSVTGDVPAPAKKVKLTRGGLPLKFTIGCGSTAVTDTTLANQFLPSPTISAVLAPNGTDVLGDEVDIDNGSANDNGLQFRYSNGNWIYNLDPAELSLSAGTTYVFVIDMPDGTQQAAAVQFK
jgi:hypothetical protein